MYYKKLIPLVFFSLIAVIQPLSLFAQTTPLQNIQFLRQNLPNYPKLVDILRMTTINTGENINLELHFELINDNSDTLNGTVTFEAEKGISELNIDSIFLFNNSYRIITEDSTLLPGEYKINLIIKYLKKNIYTYSNQIHVSNYITKVIRNILDSSTISIEPDVNNVVHYLICYFGANHQPKSNYLISKKKFKLPYQNDSTNVNYEIHSFYKNQRVAIYTFSNDQKVKNNSYLKKTIAIYNKQNFIKISGNVTLEHLESNLKFGGQELLASYSRLYARPDITIGGLPFKANIIRGTDNNQQFPINSANIEFDAFKFKNELSKKIFQQIEIAKQEIEANNFNISKINNSNQKLSVKIKTDSLNYMNINDTAISHHKRNHLKKKINANIEELNKNKYEIDQLNNRNIKLQRLIKNKHHTRSDYQSDSTLRYSNKLYHFINNINALKFGLIYPSYSELLYSGLPLEGFLVDYSIKNISIKIANGKSPQLLINEPNNNSFVLNTKLIGVSIKSRNNILKLEFGNFNQVADASIKRMNSVLLIGNEFRVNNIIKLTTEVAKSSYENENQFNQIRYKSSTLEDFNEFENISLLINLNISIKKTQINLGFKRIDQSYLSLGAPFSRQDAEQFDLGINQSIDKNRIQIGGGLMINKDNLSENKSITTYATSGYGKLTINYIKYPKLTISYKPTQINTSLNKTLLNQSNNSTLWSQQLDNLYVIVDYNFKTAGIVHKTISTYNYFKTKDFKNNYIEYYTISSQLLSQLTSKLNFNFIYQMQFGTNIQNKAEILEVNLSKKLMRSTGIGSIGIRKENTFFNGNRQGIVSQYSKHFSNISASINISLNQVTGLWGDYYYDKLIEYRCFISVSYTL